MPNRIGLDEPQLCDDCPLRINNGEPTVMEVYGEWTGAAVFPGVSEGSPLGQEESSRFSVSEIAIGVEGGEAATNILRVATKDIDSGRVNDEFNKCKEPSRKRSDFLLMRTAIGCSALTELRGEEVVDRFAPLGSNIQGLTRKQQ